MRNNQKILFTGESESGILPRGLHWHARDWVGQGPFRTFNGQVGQMEWIASEIYDGPKEAYLYKDKLTLPFVPEHLDPTGKPEDQVVVVNYPPDGSPAEPHIVFHASARVMDLLEYTTDPNKGFRVQIRAKVSHYTEPAHEEITASAPVFKLVDDGNNPIIEVSQERRAGEAGLFVTAKYFPDNEDLAFAHEQTFKIPGSEATDQLPQNYQIQATEGYLLVTAGTYTASIKVQTYRSLFKETKFRFFHGGGGTNVGLKLGIYDIAVFPYQRS